MSVSLRPGNWGRLSKERRYHSLKQIPWSIGLNQTLRSNIRQSKWPCITLPLSFLLAFFILLLKTNDISSQTFKLTKFCQYTINLGDLVRKLLNLPISVTDYVVNIHGNSGPGNEKCPVKKSTVAPFGPSIKDVWLTRGEGDLGKPDIYCYHSNVFSPGWIPTLK